MVLQQSKCMLITMLTFFAQLCFLCYSYYFLFIFVDGTLYLWDTVLYKVTQTIGKVSPGIPNKVCMYLSECFYPCFVISLRDILLKLINCFEPISATPCEMHWVAHLVLKDVWHRLIKVQKYEKLESNKNSWSELILLMSYATWNFWDKFFITWGDIKKRVYTKKNYLLNSF